MDNLDFLSKSTLKKSINFLKIGSSYFISKYTKRPVHWGFPASISIEPTTLCNLRCLECPSGSQKFSRNTGMIDYQFYTDIIDALHPYLSYLILYFQGEPYLHPDFFKLVNYANKKNIYTATSSNAHFLDNKNAKNTVESQLDRLIISIDGTTQDIYSIYRKKGNLNKVIEGTKNIIKWKKKLNSKKPYVIFQFLVIKPNQHQVEEVKQLGRKLGVNKTIIKTAQIYDFKKGSPLIPTSNKYSRYRKNKDGTYSIKTKLKNNCWRLWNSCVITWDGIVVPCCFDKNAKYKMGNLKQESFDDIWNGKFYADFRQSILHSRKDMDICRNCTE